MLFYLGICASQPWPLAPAPICIWLPLPQFVFNSPGANLYLPASVLNLYLPALAN